MERKEITAVYLSSKDVIALNCLANAANNLPRISDFETNKPYNYEQLRDFLHQIELKAATMSEVARLMLKELVCPI